MSLSSKIMENVLSPVIVGSLAGLGLKLMYPQTRSVNLLGVVSLPDYAVYGGLVGAASAVSESLKLWVLPLIPNNQYVGLESLILAPAITGVTGSLAFNAFTDSKLNSFWTPFILAASSNFTGKSIYNYFF